MPAFFMGEARQGMLSFAVGSMCGRHAGCG